MAREEDARGSADLLRLLAGRQDRQANHQDLGTPELSIGSRNSMAARSTASLSPSPTSYRVTSGSSLTARGPTVYSRTRPWLCCRAPALTPHDREGGRPAWLGEGGPIAREPL